jgi:hypothetical protein
MKSKTLEFLLVYIGTYQILFGYLDPGSWSYALQILLITLVGGIVAIKSFWQKIILFIKKLFKK